MTVETYRGYPIVVYATLGSGQTTYAIQGIPIEGRNPFVTTIASAKILIDKHLGDYQASDPGVQQVMTQETLDQLNAGTLALWELERQNELDASRIQTLTDMRDDIGQIDDSIQTLDGIMDPLFGQVGDMATIVDDAQNALNERQAEINELTSTLEDMTANVGALQAYAESMGMTLEEATLQLEQSIELNEQAQADLEGIDWGSVFGGGGGMFSGLKGFALAIVIILGVTVIGAVAVKSAISG